MVGPTLLTVSTVQLARSRAHSVTALLQAVIWMLGRPPVSAAPADAGTAKAAAAARAAAHRNMRFMCTPNGMNAGDRPARAVVFAGPSEAAGSLPERGSAVHIPQPS